jgi:hypothetical protein
MLVSLNILHKSLNLDLKTESSLSEFSERGEEESKSR